MKFIYTAGQYTQYLGRMFAFGKPTEVTDKATIAALLKRSDFRRVEDEQAKVEAPAAPAVLKTVAGRPVLTVKRK